MDRRAFLATPLVFGLREVLAQEPKDPAVAEWWPAARKRMKETGRPGVVLVVPQAERARQHAGLILHRILAEDPAAAHQLFVEAVFVGMTPALADGRVRTAGEKVDRILLSPDGKRLAADVSSWAGAPKDAELVESLRSFLHGEKGERLAERAAEAEKRIPEAARTAIAALDAEDFEERAKASAVLAKHAADLVPYLIRLSREDASLERRWRAGAAVKQVFQAADPEKAGPRLPYGCAPQREHWDSCPTCGLAVAPAPARYFLRFLSS
jgi:hypothetical protein